MAKQFNVKIGINPISWMNDDLPSLGGETPLDVALSEGAQIGYRGFELGNKFPKEAAALAAVLGKYSLECVSGWYSGRLATGTVEDEIIGVGPHLRLLAENGAKVMVYGEVANAIQGRPEPLYKRPQFTTPQQWQEYADKLTAFATYTLSHGVRLSYHHHMGAYVETAADIDRLMALTGESVGLLFDSGHITFAGGDALAVLTKHIARVSHVHCKDVRPSVMKLARNGNWSFLQAVINGAFTVPGDGAIDFSALLLMLYHHDYQGWLVVEAEQDPAVAPSYQYAEMGYQHLAGLVQGIESGSIFGLEEAA
ncbi:myo-inosose-2 dehydratase [Glaciimonas sp. CA11.2]|uniref:myo-inosose-2 dehydratase n=1 Tax=unclassified Glaciimonas TaxID=2644401 RepID=UPI002AB5D336|nr:MULTISPECIES: myo-inosose-2 dehydratase [unclassified Glaciimonas]MDY7547674.1 myo-inosose-2 dehydratase [Glaciimonas sp. CA11.2]MEB0013006.1 myo-inosose-2 dehydratase [Glaciimonas sp. Cout2]MEB0083573.1 myo-inosose-2 dehydratase [Glaciimonas sp. Gout2]MEB0162632.1 myo-inosose-2 dehydratase [Glaciimonas sp. CA11.2]